MCLEVRKFITPVIAFIWEELGTCSAVGGATGYFIALLSVLNTGTTLLSRPFSTTLVLRTSHCSTDGVPKRHFCLGRKGDLRLEKVCVWRD